MRNLETEVLRLKEAYTTEIAEANANAQQQREITHAIREENEILREILAAHGIQYEADLDRRRAERPPMVGYQSSPVDGSSTASASQTAGFTQSVSNHNTTPATTISSSGMSPLHNTIDHSHSEVSPPIAYAPQQQVYQTSPGEQPMGMDRSSCAAVDSVQPMPRISGVFESDPQLQVDFILT
jgi:hypothetical protein